MAPESKRDTTRLLLALRVGIDTYVLLVAMGLLLNFLETQPARSLLNSL